MGQTEPLTSEELAIRLRDAEGTVKRLRKIEGMVKKRDVLRRFLDGDTQGHSIALRDPKGKVVVELNSHPQMIATVESYVAFLDIHLKDLLRDAPAPTKDSPE